MVVNKRYGTGSPSQRNASPSRGLGPKKGDEFTTFLRAIESRRTDPDPFGTKKKSAVKIGGFAIAAKEVSADGQPAQSQSSGESKERTKDGREKEKENAALAVLAPNVTGQASASKFPPPTPLERHASGMTVSEGGDSTASPVSPYSSQFPELEDEEEEEEEEEEIEVTLAEVGRTAIRTKVTKEGNRLKKKASSARVKSVGGASTGSAPSVIGRAPGGHAGLQEGVHLYMMGWTAYGDAGFLPDVRSHVFFPQLMNIGPPADRIIQIAQGELHTLLLTDEGVVYSYGSGDGGRLGHGSSNNEPYPRLIQRLKNKRVVQIACGGRHSAAVTADGLLYMWGDGSMGQLGLKGTESSYHPKLVTDPFFKEGKFVTRVACGTTHTLVLVSGSVIYAFGNNSSGQLGIASRQSVISGGLPSANVSTGGGSARIPGAGPGATGGLGSTSGSGAASSSASVCVTVPKLTRWPRTKRVISLSAGDEHSCCVDQDGVLYTWGSGIFGQTMSNFIDRETPTPVIVARPFLDHHQDSEDDSDGDGTGSFVKKRSKHKGRSSPELSDDFVRFSQVCCGYMHTVAVSVDGLVYTAGLNSSGQLGLGHLLNVGIPSLVESLTHEKIIDVAAGFKHTVLISERRRVFVVGDTEYGQCGQGPPEFQRLRTRDGASLAMAGVEGGIGIAESQDRPDFQAVPITKPRTIPSISDLTAKAIAAGCYQTFVLCDLLDIEERQKLIELFKSVDTGGDGTLNEHEIGEVFARLGRPLLKSERRLLMKALDNDGNGFITLEEFLNHVVALQALLDELSAANGKKKRQASVPRGRSGSSPPKSPNP
jgi:hypothetical protein